MRLLIKMVMMSVAMVGLASYGGYIMTGKPIWEVAKLPSFASVKTSQPLRNLSSLADEPIKDKVYKWRDSDGVLHYSSEAPVDGAAAQLLEINSKTNVIPAVKPKKEPEAEPAETTVSKDKESDKPPLYTPEGVQDVLQQARDVQQMMNDRATEQKKILDNL